MKKFTVRAFVLTLAIAGAVATSQASMKPTSSVKKVVLTDAGANVPMCNPKGASKCGMD